MARIPTNPKIYHITHVRNLPSIIDAGWLWSDAKRTEKQLRCDVVGMSHIKRRRLQEYEVRCHPGTYVGDYVPFYFCPRSIMLYILHMGNHQDLDYHEGQRPIVHLQADLHEVVRWAEKKRRRWAFSDRNAGATLAAFFDNVSMLDRLNWSAIRTNRWGDLSVKEGKQAEFLIHGSFPWRLVKRIGAIDEHIVSQVRQIIADAEYQPPVMAEPSWYY